MELHQEGEGDSKDDLSKEIKADRQKGHLRKSLRATLVEVTKYKDELAKMAKENNDLREPVKTKESKIKLLEKRLTPFQCDKCDYKTKEKRTYKITC